jgi:amino-acid N-acetyltransferase
MSEVEVSISKASTADLAEILALLESVNLPTEGVSENLGGFLIARDSEGRLIGSIGLERHRKFGLLRSAAVAPNLQNSGLGSKLTANLLELAKVAGIEDVLLLTSTARDFFGRRFGFAEARRADYDSMLADSSEWNLPRCSSAVLMKLAIHPKSV